MANKDMTNNSSNITLRSILIGLLLAGFFAAVTVFFENRHNTYLTATQIAPAPYFVLFVMVLLLNPLCKVLRFIRRFSITEVLVIFIMGSVAAGISTFGLASQLVPVMSSLFNRHWNHDQSEWNLYVEPYVNESFFISEAGIRPAARLYRDALLANRQLERVYDHALRLQRNRNAVAAAEQRRDSFVGAGNVAAAARVNEELNTLTLAGTEALAAWQLLPQQLLQQQLPDVDTVVATYPAMIQAQSLVVTENRQALSVLEEKAFAKVELFRRGLPNELRAFPGIIPLQGENFSIYSSRLSRLRSGVRARGNLQTARQNLSNDNAAAAREIAAAVELLQPHTDASELQFRNDEINGEISKLNRKNVDAQATLGALRVERRDAHASDFGGIDRRINAKQRTIKKLGKHISELNMQREQVQTQLAVAGRVADMVAKLQNLHTQLQTRSFSRDDADAADAEIAALLAVFPSIDASWRRFLLSDIPWEHWLKPTLLWLVVIALTYLLLMSFNVLIFRQWAYNERLIYPLAELPEIIAGHSSGEQDSDEAVPAIFKSGLFWAGFALSLSFLGWNFLVQTNLLPGLKELDFTNNWVGYIGGTPFSGLLPNARSAIFFTLIGLTFLVPANISFSLWFFYILYMAQLLVMVWSGYGVNENSFPSEWYYTLNFRTAEGGGALMVFAVVVLYKCRHYLFCAFNRARVLELPEDEQTELRLSSAAFIASSVGLVIALWLGLGANLLYTLFLYFVVIVITVGLVRAVTEGGILGFQAWISPFHFIRTVFGMDRAWTSPSLFAPLTIFYSILFLDLKTFIAPAMANGLKIRDDRKMGRLRFHTAVFLAIFAAGIVAIVVHIMMGYSRGGDAMNGWFYTAFPRDVFGQISAMTKNPPVDTSGNIWWCAGGMLMMGGLLYLRQVIFWMPHPIGLIMLVNPLMATYWFSIFIGWCAKRLVTKYGNKDTYNHTRRFFIGLIFGELSLVVLALIVSYFFDMRININLNRN